MLTIDDIVSFAKEHHLDSISLNDDNMYAVMEFVTKCNQNNIKPILSLSVTLEDATIVLFAKNYSGYQSLIKLSTISSKEKIKKEDCIRYKKDLLVVLPYSYSYLYEELKDIYQEVWIGYQTLEEEEKASKITKDIVVFKEALYLGKKDIPYLKSLYLIRDGKTVMDNVYYELENHELEVSFPARRKEGLENTKKIASLCNVTFSYDRLLLPIYKDTKSLDPNTYLVELSIKGLSKRFSNHIPKNYQERLMYELDVIQKMGFSNYFLVVYDFIKYAKKNHILVGPGRGSAAGSLVSFSLGITDIDPIRYDLLFERFLNPERKQMPDIDTDFPDDKREEVIRYVISKYGEKNVAGIVTFGTLGMKQVVRDVSRILNIPLYKVNSLSHYIPNMTKDTLEEFYQKNPGFKAQIDSDQELKKMYAIATKIEGYPRHTSSHAAGIVMSEYPLDEMIPLTYSDGFYLSAYPQEYLESLGLLKMDFLGLKNLTIISNILEDIKNNYQEEILFSAIPLDDREAIKVFTGANTCGIFQFESTGMRNFLKKLQPKTLEDIFAAIALFRPGPADNIDLYIRRKNHLEEVTYLDPCLEDILKNTYGIIIYQEQIIQIANRYAGYTLGEADILRRAMSKKKLSLLQKEEERFLAKSLEKGHDIETAKKIYALILKFAGFGFNRSHSVAYSIIAYKMAYLRVRFPYEFFANLLSNVIGAEYKTKEYILEAKKEHIRIDKPDINLSSSKYIVHNHTILYPFSNIKRVGSVSSNAILKARGENPFQDIYDCFSRLVICGIQKTILESLIYADCFRCFSYNKNTLIKNLDSLYNYAELTKDLDPSLVMKPEIERYEEFSNSELLEQERLIFGFYLTHHPTTYYQKSDTIIVPLNEIKSHFNKEIDTIVLVEKVKVITTKKQEEMSFLTGSDETTMIDFTLFPRIYRLYPNIVRGDILKIRGNVEKRLEDYQIIVRKIEKLNRDGD